MGFYSLGFLVSVIAVVGFCVYWGTRASLVVGGIGVLLFAYLTASLYLAPLQRLREIAGIGIYPLFFVSVILTFSGLVGLITSAATKVLRASS